MKAVKGNKVYTITESEKKAYQDAGYDIFDDKGNVEAYGRGKTVSYEQYVELEKENTSLKKKVASFEKEAKTAKDK